MQTHRWISALEACPLGSLSVASVSLRLNLQDWYLLSFCCFYLSLLLSQRCFSVLSFQPFNWIFHLCYHVSNFQEPFLIPQVLFTQYADLVSQDAVSALIYLTILVEIFFLLPSSSDSLFELWSHWCLLTGFPPIIWWSFVCWNLKVRLWKDVCAREVLVVWWASVVVIRLTFTVGTSSVRTCKPALDRSGPQGGVHHSLSWWV